MGKVRIQELGEDSRGRKTARLRHMEEDGDLIPEAQVINVTEEGQLVVGGRFVQLTELSADPAAPAANMAVLYLKDNGSGKTLLCCRFSSGAVQTVATQP